MGKQTQVEAHDAGPAVPGKRTLAEQLPASDLLARVKARAGESIDDGAGYMFAVQVEGTFQVIATPHGGEKSKQAIISPTRQSDAWMLLARRLVAKPAPEKPATATPAPAPVAPAPPPDPSLIDRALSALDELREDASDLWSRAQELVHPHPAAPAPTTSPAAKPAIPPSPASRPAAVSRTTLDLALTRAEGDYGAGGTEYTRDGKAQADKDRLAAIDKQLADKSLSADDRKTLTDERATLATKLKNQEHAFAAALMRGDADQKQFYCSGLSVWTLAAAGHDVSQKIVGSDGKPYYAEVYKVGKDGKQVVAKTVYATLKGLIDGEPESVEVMTLAAGRTTGGLVGEFTGAGYQTAHEGDELPTAARGAPGAFVLAGLGTEVAELAQKPGDFAQARHMSTTDTDKELKHRGAGHAWQVVAVKAKGAAMFGRPGSPKSDAAATGWHDNVEFVIDESTDPRLVGKHVVTHAQRVEANIAGAMTDKKSDTDHDGGVQVTGYQAVPDTNPNKYPGNVLFYGRLASNPWSGWTEATDQDGSSGTGTL